ncbi:MAG: hypothetical protein ACLTA5_01445 [Anaerococcus obesiensis]
MKNYNNLYLSFLLYCRNRDYFIIFDYYKGVLNIPEDKIVILLQVMDILTIHFRNFKIPNMKNYTYILSSDIGHLESDDNIIYIKDNKLGMDQLKSLYNSKNVYLVDHINLKKLILMEENFYKNFRLN